MLHKILNALTGAGGSKPSAQRSSEWPRVRKEHLAKEPRCRVCGSRGDLNVHHVRPYHLFPELELHADNLITLCEGAGNCHLTFGHLRSWKSWNSDVRNDAAIWFWKIRGRPVPGGL